MSAAVIPEDVRAVIQRVERRFQNECVENQHRPYHARTDVGGWLAGVSFREWFALVEVAERLAADGEPVASA